MTMEYEHMMFVGGPNHGERRNVFKGIKECAVVQHKPQRMAPTSMVAHARRNSPSVIYTRREVFSDDDTSLVWFSPQTMSDTEALAVMLAACEKRR